jgi:hypothetical protein
MVIFHSYVKLPEGNHCSARKIARWTVDNDPLVDRVDRYMNWQITTQLYSCCSIGVRPFNSKGDIPAYFLVLQPLIESINSGLWIRGWNHTRMSHLKLPWTNCICQRWRLLALCIYYILYIVSYTIGRMWSYILSYVWCLLKWTYCKYHVMNCIYEANIAALWCNKRLERAMEREMGNIRSENHQETDCSTRGLSMKYHCQVRFPRRNAYR